MPRKPKTDLELFDPSDVEWEVLPQKRRDQVTIRLTATEGSMNLMKTYLALVMICEKVELQLGILEMASDVEH